MAKTYCCPYCKEKFNKEKLIDHIEKEHDDELPESYTAYRAAYDVVNDKPGHGYCVICHSPTKWNEKRQKYERLCGKKECSKKVKEVYQTRMMKVYGKVHLLDDPYHQEKMLSHRHIAGKYKWSDGTMFEYVGSYEKELLEFLDKTLEYRSDEILSPGPVLEYTINGKKRHWITDFLIIPHNLVIEVKDGGSNPNKRFMPEYRAKQYAKEKMITNMGVYSYLRLTNKDFSQLLGILAELKKNIIDDEKGPIYRIHEEVNLLSEITDAEPVLEFIFPDIITLEERFSDPNILNPLNNLLSLNVDSMFISHPEDDYLIYEVVTIKPKIINKYMQELFSNYVDSLKPTLDNIENVELYLKNKDNISEGIGIGIVF